jgi:large subunit ribosomal protein L6
MSRLGKKPIEVPEKTEVNVSEGVVTVKGPLGELSLPFKPVVDIKVADGEVTLTPKNDEIQTKALWGTYSSHVLNMINGVNKEYEKTLIIEGVGYKAEMKGDSIVLNIGFSHPVELKLPEGVKCAVEKNTIKVSGIDKESVGEFAAVIRSKKKPEPYKGKGIRYEDEVIIRKEGKKAV